MKKPAPPLTATAYGVVAPPTLPPPADPWKAPDLPVPESGLSPFPHQMPEAAPLPSRAERKKILEGEMRPLFPPGTSVLQPGRPLVSRNERAGDERDRLIEAQARQIEALERHIDRLERLLASALDDSN